MSEHRPAHITRLSVTGFRSIRHMNLILRRDVTVMIGPNGAGKSNLLRFAEMLRAAWGFRRLPDFVRRQGGGDDQLFAGSKITRKLLTCVDVAYGEETYQFDAAFEHAAPDELVMVEGESLAERVGSGFHPPEFFKSFMSYQFHDTTPNSPLRLPGQGDDVERLAANGDNLAPMLLYLEREHTDVYDRICRVITMVLPDFDRFELADLYGKVTLKWRSRSADKVIGPHLTSDGSLRFFALATLLNLPSEMMPPILFLDEPELGLHPSAISVLASMIETIGRERQVIVCTQSPQLVDGFSLDQIVVVDWEDGESKFRIVDAAEYEHWLDDYTTGELWQKNLFGGRP